MPSSSSSEAYAYKPGGSLKFKGSSKDSGSTSGSSYGNAKRKHKKKSKSSTTHNVQHSQQKQHNVTTSSERTADQKLANHDERNDYLDEQDASLHPQSTQGNKGRSMTEAERKFEQVRLQRLKERVSQKAKLSHKERVDQFNKSLADRSEHNDMLTVAGH